MNDSLLIACDLHNTLLSSGIAWAAAFTELSGCKAESIKKALESKRSRHLLAAQLNLCYDDVYHRYTELLEINRGIVEVLSILRKTYPIVLISSASRVRVNKDLNTLDELIQFDKVFTKETFHKNNLSDWERLREVYHVDRILYFGNDPIEDVSPAEFVQTVFVHNDIS